MWLQWQLPHCRYSQVTQIAVGGGEEGFLVKLVFLGYLSCDLFLRSVKKIAEIVAK